MKYLMRLKDPDMSALHRAALPIQNLFVRRHFPVGMTGQ